MRDERRRRRAWPALKGVPDRCAPSAGSPPAAAEQPRDARPRVRPALRRAASPRDALARRNATVAPRRNASAVRGRSSGAARRHAPTPGPPPPKPAAGIQSPPRSDPALGGRARGPARRIRRAASSPAHKADYQNRTGRRWREAQRRLGWFWRSAGTPTRCAPNERFRVCTRQSLKSQVRSPRRARDWRAASWPPRTTPRAARGGDLTAPTWRRSWRAPVARPASRTPWPSSTYTAALAEIAVEERWVRPVMENGLAFAIEAGRHPVVAAGAGPIPSRLVPND